MAAIANATISATYDALLVPVLTQLSTEYDKNHITGPDFTKVYIAAITTGMQQAVALELGRQQADKTADLIAAQILTEGSRKLAVEADTSVSTNQAAKIVVDTTTSVAQELNVKQQTAMSVAQETLVPEQKLQLQAQTSKIGVDETVSAQQKLVLTQDVLNKQEQVLASVLNKLKITADTNVSVQNLANGITQNTVLLAQELKIDSEKSLMDQKALTEEAQIVDRVTGAAADVAGVVGKQKGLYTAQTDGFARDAEQKVLSAILDTYQIRRSTDNGTVTPSSISDAELDKVVNQAKLGIGVV